MTSASSQQPHRDLVTGLVPPQIARKLEAESYAAHGFAEKAKRYLEGDGPGQEGADNSR